MKFLNKKKKKKKKKKIEIKESNFSKQKKPFFYLKSIVPPDSLMAISNFPFNIASDVYAGKLRV